MKKTLLEIFIFCLMLVLLISFISAGWFGDIFGKINGNVIEGEECIFENPKDLTKENYILISNYYYGDNDTQYAERYCQVVQECASFDSSSVVEKDDAVKACRCDNYWGCNGESCVTDVSTIVLISSPIPINVCLRRDRA